jgi:hypothetical protein
MVDKNLEALREADADKGRTERVVGEVTLEVCCSAEESFGNKPTGERKEIRRESKEYIIWKKLKMEVEIRDLLSSDSEEDECGEEKRKQAENLLRWEDIDEVGEKYCTRRRHEDSNISWRKTEKERKD